MTHWSDKLIKSPGFCTRPFFHTYLGQAGSTKVCCNNTEYSYGDISSQSFDDLISKKNDKLTDFRRQFIDSDKLPHSCRSCEDPVNNHYRQQHIDLTRHILKQFDTPEDLINNEKIYTYDIRFSNLCNLKCQYCSPDASSRIAAKLYDSGRLDRILLTLGDENISQILARFEASINDVVEFYFAGGEPLIMKEHYDILDICIKHRKFDIRLAYNSNLTILETKKYNIFDYWKNFKKVGLNASIDAGWEQFEFIRSGGDWAKVVENLKKVRQLPNVHVTITPTVAFWNMIHIPKVYKYLRENNLLGRQTHNFGGEILRHDLLKPSVLPLAYKNYIRELYETEYKEYPEVKVLLKYLDDDDSHLLPETKKYVEELGKKQNCDIYSVFPEFKDIFNGLQ